MLKKQIVINNILTTYYVSEAAISVPPKFLFLHGWRSESAVWFDIMNKLESLGYGSVAVDLPGFGGTSKPEQPFETNNYGDFTSEFIEKMSLSSIIPVGHSYGGRTIINLAVRFPDKFEKIILVDSSGLQINEQKKSLMQSLSKIVKPIFKLPFMKPIRKMIYSKIGSEDYIAAEGDAFFEDTYASIIKDNYESLLPRIKAETLIVWGDKDLDTPIEMANTLKQKIPNSKLKIFEGAGHYSFQENEEEFVKGLVEFVKG